MKKEKYSGFIYYGEVTPEKPDTMASEALLFLLVGTRTHWKCPEPFIRTIDRLFDILNSRNPVAKGYKQPLRPESKDTCETMLKTTANYLLTLKTVADNDNPEQFLSTHPRKTFVIGFVATIKSTIEMANNMFTMEELSSIFSHTNTLKTTWSCYSLAYVPEGGGTITLAVYN